MSCPSRSVQVDKPQVSYFRVTLSELYTCGVAVPRSLYQVHRNQDGAAAVSELPYPSRSLRVYRNQRGRSRLGARVRVTATRTRVLGCAASRGGCIGAAAAETPDAQQAAVAAYCYAMQLVAYCYAMQLIRAYCSTHARDTRRGGGLTRTQRDTKQAVL